VSVPIFDQVNLKLADKTLTIVKKNAGRKLTEITYDDKKLDGYFIPHHELIKGKKLVIVTR
jgi:putative alpha-1,2-mannosidase